MFGKLFGRPSADDAGNTSAAKCRSLLAALAKVKPRSSGPDDREAAWREQNQLIAAIGALADDVTDTLVARLRDDRTWGQVTRNDGSQWLSYTARQRVIQMLGDRGSHAAVSQLRTELRDGPPRDKIQAINALGAAGDRSAVDDLVRALEHPDAEVRKVIPSALARIGASQASAALLAALDDASEDVRGNAAGALALLGRREAIEPIRKLLRAETNQHRQQRFMFALGRLGDTEVAAELERRVDDPHWHVSVGELAHALNGVGNRRAARRAVGKGLTYQIVQTGGHERHFQKAKHARNAAILTAWWKNFRDAGAQAAETLDAPCTDETAGSLRASLIALVDTFGRPELMQRVEDLCSPGARSDIEHTLEAVRKLAGALS